MSYEETMLLGYTISYQLEEKGGEDDQGKAVKLKAVGKPFHDERR